MDIKRLGSLFQTRSSFMRVLVRRMMRDQWRIEARRFELDAKGLGFVDYQITTPKGEYSYLVFAHELNDDERNDRVIAERWDVTMALCKGPINRAQIADLSNNVPKQEDGRYSSDVLVLSRGNRSSRMFDYVVDCLAQGRQPEVERFEEVGYLYRTTAVYGSGKFGMADWRKVKAHCPDFASPFAAEMFNCFMLRHFSIQQAEHLAQANAPAKAATLDAKIKRYIGIGNSTGLGMAPFLIRHPQLISAWVYCRERNYARVKQHAPFSQDKKSELAQLVRQAHQHLGQTWVADSTQQQRNHCSIKELQDLEAQIQTSTLLNPSSGWQAIYELIASASITTQELLVSIMMELFPDIANEEYPAVEEGFEFDLNQSIENLKLSIEAAYDWALDVDLENPSSKHFFWYQSEEKMEPRLGERFNEPGAEKEMPLTIALQVADLYAATNSISGETSVGAFLSTQPQFSSIVRRVQTMSRLPYGEIRVNVADEQMKPMDLLRCKLSFFGVSKFDPKSSLWVRNTMFQGAPIVADIGESLGEPFNDDWYFPVRPSTENA